MNSFHSFATPDFSFLLSPNVYVIALTLALVGSLETLLSVEATDKLDPDKNHTPTNRELKAQGIGNIISGAIGGLPITQVIVRSSANINMGAKSRLSTSFSWDVVVHLCCLYSNHFEFDSLRFIGCNFNIDWIQIGKN